MGIIWDVSSIKIITPYFFGKVGRASEVQSVEFRFTRC